MMGSQGRLWCSPYLGTRLNQSEPLAWCQAYARLVMLLDTSRGLLAVFGCGIG